MSVTIFLITRGSGQLGSNLLRHYASYTLLA